MNEIEKIVLESIDLAKRFHHEYVTIEHVCVMLLEDNYVKTMCLEVNADNQGLQEALMLYLNEDCRELIVDPDAESNPRKTQMLERVFNRALTQALFQGRKGINQFDMLISVLTETESASYKFALEMGLDRDKISYWLIDSLGLPGQPSAAQRTPEITAHTPNSSSPHSSSLEVLHNFTTNMNAEYNNYEDLIGREQELSDLVQTIARKKKSNAILVGPSGVGKTAIVEGLSKLIVDGEVPDIIKDKTVLSLDMAKLVAGTKYRGDFEERIKQLSEALENVDDVILFIDEIHQIIGAGSTGQNSMDAGNILKPALSSGKLKVIGATTDEEYRKIIEKESALSRRFTKISVDEPTVDETKEILRNTLISYEVYHGINIDPAASDLAVDLSVQHMFNKQLPDKAFDIIDRACAYNRICAIEERVGEITDKQVREEVTRLTGIPVEHLGVQETKEQERKHVYVEKYLNNTVFGQPHAIKKVVDSVMISLAGLKDPGKPIASYLFTGPTGVGKTETAKRLAESMQMKLVRFDMSEYQEAHSVSKLIGSPPGYVGHGDGKAGDGLLITQLEDHPNCVLLLDEVEKAHPDIMSVLLALLDDGVITSSNGKQVSGKNAIVIMTSNLGAREGGKKSIGFNDSTYNARAVDEAVNKFFAPEFRNRLDGIIKFNALEQVNMRQIVDKFLLDIERYLKPRNIKIIWNNKLKDFLEEKGFDPAMGARPLARLINQEVKLPMSHILLEGDGIDWIEVTYHDGKVTVFSGKDVEVLEHDSGSEAAS